MPYNIKVKSNDVDLRAKRQTLAERVVAQFELPAKPRLLCFLDDVDWDFLKGEWGPGKSNRGIHIPTEKDIPLYPEWYYWPDYLQESIASPGPSGWLKYDFDNVVYLHGSTCERVVGLVMTLAHELQHVTQYINQRIVWAENNLVTHLQRDFLKQIGLKAWDLPIEREARIVSKRVAEHLYGEERVGQYIEEKINEAIEANDSNDESDWQFVREFVIFDLLPSGR